MLKTKTSSATDLESVDYLKERYKVYKAMLLDLLAGADSPTQSTVLTLAMRLVKEETSQDVRHAEQAWKTGVFAELVKSLIVHTACGPAREEFVEKFVEEYDDVRFYTFYTISNFLSRTDIADKPRADATGNALNLLSSIEGIPDSQDQLEDWYGETSHQPKHQLLSLTQHKKRAQEAWLAVLRSELSKDQRKNVLAIMSSRVTPWFSQVELLMDFLTDSYNFGGATSLLALSGLFYLMQEKNLDYPQFFQKLYSLLDHDLLHSKHRSRFFRLLDTFMSSTHLPAALVASFIKRLSRLALLAPPGAIVVVLPWIYNMLKKHPTCTFMIHREIRDPAARKRLEEEGMSDPFNMLEEDPMATRAIDSCLWEIEILQGHYHPNVATLAKIISEQFTKRNYNLEDFLDHSYAGLIDAELGKELKKAPVVEFEIPKRIFTTEEGRLDRLGSLLSNAIGGS
ncbi:Maturation and nuclear export of 40S ribosomal subunits interacting protein [Elasticomyces elasticus]|nr:Maturation and nuclear export of 40S ribosomal subunits interacting protein [Elasticomyces elasticus]KAK4985556.1 Maturation and nuclear export of 40S ribosomal subunits interacting protein [Elasticomyces elasticus]